MVINVDVYDNICKKLKRGGLTCNEIISHTIIEMEDWVLFVLLVQISKVSS